MEGQKESRSSSAVQEKKYLAERTSWVYLLCRSRQKVLLRLQDDCRWQWWVDERVRATQRIVCPFPDPALSGILKGRPFRASVFRIGDSRLATLISTTVFIIIVFSIFYSSAFNSGRVYIHLVQFTKDHQSEFDFDKSSLGRTPFHTPVHVLVRQPAHNDWPIILLCSINGDELVTNGMVSQLPVSSPDRYACWYVKWGWSMCVSGPVYLNGKA